MHIKAIPEDFQVEERTDAVAEGAGDFAFYRLEKTGWTTPDALQAIRRRWTIDTRRLSHGGLKDRHAKTVQFFTIFRGPQRQLHHERIAVTYLGQRSKPYTADEILANRFQVVIRDLTTAAIARAVAALDEVRQVGVPNYFDDQRFGSVADSEAFFAKFLIQGNFEQALKTALTATYEFDRSAQKKEKSILRDHWGKWARCKELLPKGGTRSLIESLVRSPDDFKGAIARMRADLRSLYLSAYQSHLWNRMIAAWLVEKGLDCVQVPLRLGEVPMLRTVDADALQELQALQWPLPSARFQFAENDPRQPIFDRVLAAEGLTQAEFKIQGLREAFFSKGDRPALCLPTDVKHDEEYDDLHKGKEMLTLRFDLPRGSYATLIVKRITRWHEKREKAAETNEKAPV